MKKLIILLIILLPAIALGQEDRKKTAETFVADYFKLFEDKKYDQVLNLICEDGKYFDPNHTNIRPLHKVVKDRLEYIKNNEISFKYEVNSISADVIGTTSAMVIARYLQSTIKSGDISMSDNLDIYVLELKEGSWKIKENISRSTYPVIFSENIEKKWQTGNVGAYRRLGAAFNQTAYISLFLMENSKKNGTTPAQVGKALGAYFTKYSDGSKGFENLVSGFFWYVQAISPYIEVLERNENSFKIKYIPYDPSLISSKICDITREEYLAYTQNEYSEISTFMGGTCSIVDDGKYYTLTLNTK